MYLAGCGLHTSALRKLHIQQKLKSILPGIAVGLADI
jgi:hypothetical protein